jgi:hypothetical protein
MKPWLCVIGLALSLGCATAVVRPYVGDQQSWPTASGGIVNTKYSLPVFTSLPPVPYDVLAELRISSPFYAQPEEGHMPKLVEKAKEIQADALVFVQGRVFFSTNYGPRNGADSDAGIQKAPTLTTVNTFNPESFAPEVTILAIRWIGNSPPGFPSHKKAAPVAVAPSSAAPTPATTVATKPAPSSPTPPAAQNDQKTDTNSTPSQISTPSPATEKKDEQNLSVAPTAEQSNAGFPSPAPSTVSKPATPPGQ